MREEILVGYRIRIDPELYERNSSDSDHFMSTHPKTITLDGSVEDEERAIWAVRKYFEEVRKL